jgi:hypothetical protein
VGPDVIQEIEDQTKYTRKMIKEVKDQKKSYAYAHLIDRNHEVGHEVFLQVKSHKG